MESSIASLSLSEQSMSASSSSQMSETPATSIRSGKAFNRPYKFSTLCATVDNPDANHRDQFGSSSVPIYQTATFKGMGGEYDYTRSGNPTRKFLENHIAKISNARHAFAISSGMGALDVIFRMLQPGDEIIAGNDLYGGSNRLLTYLKQHNNITTHHIATTRVDNFLPYVTQPNCKVKLVLLETPTNPLLQIADLSAIADLVHTHLPEALVVADNTMMSPYLQRPLEHGADIVYDSATKYLSGHHDLMAGVITCDRDDVAKRIAFTINSVGNGLAPFDCFLLLRGSKTLALRMDQQQVSAQAVAEYLDRLGFRVLFPGLPNHPGRETHEKHARGPGAVLSFITGDKALSERIVAAARLWGISVSFGCVNSLISMPCLMSHASIDPKVRAERNLPEDLIRLCVGIEDTEDLIDDLEAALLEAGAIRPVDDGSGEQVLERVISPAAALSALPAAAHPTQELQSLVVSAPGKIILFGEHSVVHGHMAIASALDLRCYGLVEPRSDNKVSLSLPDVNLEREWDLSVLQGLPSHHDPTEAPDPHLLAKIQPLAVASDTIANTAVQTFLYLYACLAKQSRQGASFTIRATLPIGAGLGSSAALSVALVTSLLYLNSHLSLPHPPSTDPNDALHHGRRAIPNDHAKLINAWAYLAEKINHGTPSGVDNACATFGDAVAFQRSAASGVSATMEPLHGFQSLRFLLTNTKVPRDTKALVAHVGQLKLSQPDRIQSVFEAIHAVSEEARKTLTDAELPRDVQIATLETLIRQNATLLEDLEVGHAALEIVRVKTEAAPYNLSTKLTGAGGGGCALTLIPDGFDPAKLESLKKELAESGFECYETSVGGSGCGILVPHHADTKEPAEGGAAAGTIPLRTRFTQATPSELGTFLTGRQWQFV